MRKVFVVAALLALGLGATLGSLKAAARGPFLSLDRQLAVDHVAPGSALERLIRENQDFGLLRPEEARDTIPVPPWLRVYWRKSHPEVAYSAADPTGGYPLVLKEIHEWMVTHQDLERAPRPASIAPRAASAGANLRLSGAQTTPRSESAIAINFLNPSRIISASNSISSSGRQAEFFSSDGGLTWGQTTLPLTSTDKFHSDPTVDWTSDGTAWSLTIGIAGSTLKMRSYRSADGGATWTFDNTFSGTQKNTDKPMLWIDHSATSPFKDNIYAIWHNGNPAYVNHRTGPAGSWGSPLQVSSTETSGTAIGGDIKTNSVGDVFAFWPATGNSRIVVAKSTNGGVSFTRTVAATTFDSYDIGIPAMASRRALIYVSGGAYRNGTTNNVYAAWTDQRGVSGCNAPANEPGTNVASACQTRVWFTRSTDGGTTWSAPVKVNDSTSPLHDQFNQWLAVDETSGKIGLMYYDTIADTGRKKTDVWYQSSSDGGATWSTPLKVTTAETDETVAGADSGNQYGDYNGMSAYLTKFFPSWTDRRNNAHEEIWSAPVVDP
jgi:hypothetical protein